MNAEDTSFAPNGDQNQVNAHPAFFEPNRTAAVADRDAQERRAVALADAALAAAAVLILAGGIAVLAAGDKA